MLLHFTQNSLPTYLPLDASRRAETRTFILLPLLANEDTSMQAGRLALGELQCVYSKWPKGSLISRKPKPQHEAKSHKCY